MINNIGERLCRNCGASKMSQGKRFCHLSPPVTQFITRADGKVAQVSAWPEVPDDGSCYQHKAFQMAAAIMAYDRLRSTDEGHSLDD